MRHAVENGNLGQVGQIVLERGVLTVMPVFDLQPIPVMWTLDLHRSRCIAQDLQAVINTMVAQPNKCAGYFITFDHLVDSDFLDYLIRAKPAAFSIMDETNFLIAYDRGTVPVGHAPVAEHFLWACQLVFLGIQGKSAEAAGINANFNKRLKTMFAMLGRFEPPVLALQEQSTLLFQIV